MKMFCVGSSQQEALFCQKNSIVPVEVCPLLSLKPTNKDLFYDAAAGSALNAQNLSEKSHT